MGGEDLGLRSNTDKKHSASATSPHIQPRCIAADPQIQIEFKIFARHHGERESVISRTSVRAAISRLQPRWTAAPRILPSSSPARSAILPHPAQFRQRQVPMSKMARRRSALVRLTDADVGS